MQARTLRQAWWWSFKLVRRCLGGRWELWEGLIPVEAGIAWHEWVRISGAWNPDELPHKWHSAKRVLKREEYLAPNPNAAKEPGR